MAGYKNMYQLQRGNSMLSGYTEGLNILWVLQVDY
jgi:hypothetical protein